MTSSCLGQQLFFDLSAVPASVPQPPLAPLSSLFGWTPQEQFTLRIDSGDRPADHSLPPPQIVEPVEGAAVPNAPAASSAPTESDPLRNLHNYRISDSDGLGSGSLKRKCQDNLAAIEFLKRIEADDRRPTPAEKRVLVRYVGWGGLPQVFDALNEEWAQERERLEQLLTPEELDSARASTLNAHYTAPGVIGGMYAALQRLGFSHGRVLEPALGLGHFIGLMPEEMHARSRITGIEIDSVTARLAKLLYPDADIRHQPFEESRLPDGCFDVAIGNIPFGDYKPFDPRFKGWNFVAVHGFRRTA